MQKRGVGGGGTSCAAAVVGGGGGRRTMRGLMRRIMSFSHCLHLVLMALAKIGTPQLLRMMISGGGFSDLESFYHSVHNSMLR